MPGRTKTALLAVRIIGYHINRRNLRLFIYRDMIICYHTAITLREETAITSLTGCCPNLLDNGRSILHRHSLTIELGTLSTYHVEKDSITRGITIWLILTPILSAQSPGISTILNISPLRSSPILCIETYEIYSDSRIQLFVSLQLAGDFQHDCHTTCTIIGCHHRLAPVGTVGIIICPRTTVPMGTEQDTSGSLRIIMSDDIGILQYRAIISLEVCFLLLHLTSEQLELPDNPFATLVMCLAIHRARTEVALSLTISKG